MKLRNKKTGEVIEFGGDRFELAEYYEEHGGGIKNVYIYNTLSELNEDWEDYEENRVQIKIEKRPLEERLLNLEIKMADAEDDIAMLKNKIVELCQEE